MKTNLKNTKLIVLLTLMIILGIARQASAQSIELSGFAQSTVMGLQKGYALDYRIQAGFSLGVFHQSTQNFSFESAKSNYPFTGVNVGFPIKNCGDLSLIGNLKTGLVNNQFLIVTPELETRLAITKFMKIGIGAGMRSRQAALSARLIFHSF